MTTSRYMSTFSKKIGLFALALLAFSTFGTTEILAQSRNEEEIRKIQDAKIAIITNRLSLTPDQSKDFWPIYNEFSQKKRAMNRSMRLLTGGNESRTDDQAMNSLKEVQELKQKQVELEKEYQDRFLSVITAKQLTELYAAERDFNEMLLQRLK